MEQGDYKLLLARVEDLINDVRKHHRTACTSFIDPAMIKRAEALLKKYKDIKYKVFGGYAGAERNIVLIYPDWMDESDVEIPVSILSIQWNDRYYNIGHRDILGSILGLGIKREKLGDIIVVESNHAHAMVSSDISDYIIQNLVKVGKAPVTINKIAMQDLELPEKNNKLINTSISSMRLDCVASSGFGMSRNKIVPLIREGMAYVNWEPVVKPDYVLNEGDIISLRGRGRIRIAEITGKSKKNRLHIILEKW